MITANINPYCKFSKQRRFAWCAVYFGALLAVLCLSAAGKSVYAAPADNAAEDALGGYDYPWYDAETRSVKPMVPKAGQEPNSKERDSVAMSKQKANTAAAPKPAGPKNTKMGEGAGTMIALIVAAIILAGLVALVMTFLYIESNKSEQSESAGRSRKQSIEQLPFDLESTDGDFQSAADAAYRDGDLRKAIIYLYSHVLVTLDQNRMIRLRKGKTNRQYLKEVQRHKGIAGYFQQVMHPFESVFFGDHEMDAGQFQECWSGLNQFHAQVKDNAEVLIG